jgi:hypothetical protein
VITPLLQAVRYCNEFPLGEKDWKAFWEGSGKDLYLGKFDIEIREFDALLRIRERCMKMFKRP